MEKFGKVSESDADEMKDLGHALCMAPTAQPMNYGSGLMSLGHRQKQKEAECACRSVKDLGIKCNPVRK